MQAEGTEFRAPESASDVDYRRGLRAEFDAVVLACGATQARDLPIAGRELGGIHQAMEFLPPANRVQQGDLDEPPVTAKGKNVVIIGGGDTGADCLGTSHRQGAASIHQFEIMPRPPEERATSTPWPTCTDDLPRQLCARGGRRAGLLRQHRAIRRPRTARSRTPRHEVERSTRVA